MQNQKTNQLTSTAAVTQKIIPKVRYHPTIQTQTPGDGAKTRASQTKKTRPAAVLPPQTGTDHKNQEPHKAPKVNPAVRSGGGPKQSTPKPVQRAAADPPQRPDQLSNKAPPTADQVPLGLETQLDRCTVEDVEVLTRGQRTNEAFFTCTKNRITASVAHQIAHFRFNGKSKTPPISYLAAITDDVKMQNQKTNQLTSTAAVTQKIIPKVRYHPTIQTQTPGDGAKTRASQTKKTRPAAVLPPQTGTDHKNQEPHKAPKVNPAVRSGGGPKQSTPKPVQRAAADPPQRPDQLSNKAPPTADQVPLGLETQLDRCTVEDVEVLTRGQRTNEAFFTCTKNRITASVAHQIAHCRFNGKSKTPPISYLAAITDDVKMQNQKTNQLTSTAAVTQKIIPKVRYHPTIQTQTPGDGAKTRASQTKKTRPAAVLPPQTGTDHKNQEPHKAPKVNPAVRSGGGPKQSTPKPVQRAAADPPQRPDQLSNKAPPAAEQVPLGLETQLDRCTVEDVEVLTRGQRTNEAFFTCTKNRITASVAHQIAHCRFNGKSKTPPISYLAAITDDVKMQNQKTNQLTSTAAVTQKIIPKVRYHPTIQTQTPGDGAKTRASQTKKTRPAAVLPPQTGTDHKNQEPHKAPKVNPAVRSGGGPKQSTPKPVQRAAADPPQRPDQLSNKAPPAAEQVPLGLETQLDRCTVEDVEVLTRGQRTNETWFTWRKNRITASVAHQIAHCRFNGKSKTPPISYLAAIKGEGRSIQTRAMSWGINMEADVVRKYQRQKSDVLGRSVSVQQCGLFIDAERPWLAASPDGIVIDSQNGQRLLCLEVKCPYKHRHRRIEDACRDDPAFCLRIQDRDGRQPGRSPVYSLKKSHKYFTQIQCQLAVTGLQQADLAVFTLKELAIVPVTFDRDLWEETVSKLEVFHRDAVLPHLRQKTQ